MSQRYILEVYEPGSRHRVLEAYHSDHPFGAIHRGDLFACETPSHGGTDAMVVADVEHVVWGAPTGPRHKVRVFTELATKGQSHVA